MAAWRRAIGYFRRDWRLIVLLVLLVGMSFVISLVQPWVVPMLIDLVFTSARHEDWIHRLFVAALPGDVLGRVVGLAVLGLVLKVGQEATWLGLHGIAQSLEG